MLTDAPPVVDIGQIVRLVGPASFERGRQYARNSAVIEVVWFSETSTLLGTVTGTEDIPYRCVVEIEPVEGGTFRPTGTSCTCPVGLDCKHVAATVLASNAARVRNAGQAAAQAGTPDVPYGPVILGVASQLTPRATIHSAPTDSYTPAASTPPTFVARPLPVPFPITAPHSGSRSSAPSFGMEPPAEPATEPESWRTRMSALAGTTGNAATKSGAKGGGTAAADPRRPTADLALQFELREQLPRTKERWRGPIAKAASSAVSPESAYRMGIRPVIRSATGNWVRANVTWNSLAHQLNRLNLNPQHHRWFAQCAALYRATRDVYTGQEADWIYLDDYHSPLLWNLLADAQAAGIELVASKSTTTVTIGTAASIGLDVSRVGDATADSARQPLALTTVLTIDGTEHPAATAGTVGDHGVYSFTLQPAAYTIAPTTTRLTADQGRLLAGGVTTDIPASDVSEFLDEFLPKLRRSVTVTSADASVPLPEVAPPVLVLTADYRPKQSLKIRWRWEYTLGGTSRLEPLDSAGEDFRDDAAEAQVRVPVASALLPFEEVGENLMAPSFTLRGLDAAEFTTRVMPELERFAGLRIDVVGTKPDYRELTEEPQLTFKTVETDKRDWFDLGVLVSVNGHNVPFGPLFAALSQGKKKLLLVDNSYLSLDQPVFDRLKELLSEASDLSEWETGPRISRYQAALWADFEDLAEETEQAQKWREAVSGLMELADDAAEAVLDTPLPAGIQATLRPYQQQGYSWLAFLWQHGLGGVLADDMGLGKTLQALALMAYAKDQRGAGQRGAGQNGAAAPFLVVAPTSVVSNWELEAARFAPNLRVAAVTSTQSKSGLPLAVMAAGADIVVTSYALFRLDFAAYQQQEWAGLILDEAQFVKNSASKAHQCAVELNAPFKLAITGTPLENSLLDLWSLFAIVAPGLFPSIRKFTEEFVRPMGSSDSEASGANARILARLRRRIRPLMMRRTKEIVAPELPEKQEQVLQIDLDPAHKKLYDTYLQRERKKLLGLMDDDITKNRFIVFRSLTLLRLLSLDASLVDEKHAHIPSSKLDSLLEQLDEVVAEGHRALIFSQFTTFLGKAAERLEAAGIEYAYLDGSTLKRGDVIKRFKSGQAPVFLISLKAGGFGLNLTEADYVFLLDPWWNPASEAQAVDRTHRIGQTKNVMVYRMVATGTIEEKVMALKAQKSKLFTAVLDDDADFSADLTADDIRGLFDLPAAGAIEGGTDD